MFHLPPKLFGSTALATVAAILLSLLHELRKTGIRFALAKSIKEGERKFLSLPLHFKVLLHTRHYTKQFRKQLLRRLFLNLPLHFKVVRVLGMRELKPVTDLDPHHAVKYLKDNYLARSLSTNERGRILVDHYLYLKSRVDGQFFREIVHKPLTVWEENTLGAPYAIHLTFPTLTHKEGDLSLVFQADSAELFTLSFTIGPGSISNLPAAHVMYICRLQGNHGRFDSIRKATKDCGEVSPPALLLVAAEAIAMSLNIKHLIGISANDQTSIGGTSGPNPSARVYDEFWISMGAEKMNDCMFHLPVPLPEKPLSLIKQNHRSRVLRKRQFKQNVGEQVRHLFEKSAMGAAKKNSGE